jgi:hypothetical protein
MLLPVDEATRKFEEGGGIFGIFNAALTPRGSKQTLEKAFTLLEKPASHRVNKLTVHMRQLLSSTKLGAVLMECGVSETVAQRCRRQSMKTD